MYFIIVFEYFILFDTFYFDVKSNIIMKRV